MPSLRALHDLALVLEPDEAARADLLVRWLAKWAQAKALDASAPEELKDMLRAAERLVNALASPRRALPPAYPRSLAGFPEQFQPLVVVFPDRREVPPKSPADLFIRSGAATDYQFLPLIQGLDEPLRLVSDKLFMVMPEDWLRAHYSKTNLLVCGSSGVNWLTRSLADSAIFRPVIEPASMEWHRNYCNYRATTDLDHDDFLLTAFARVLEYAESSEGHRIDLESIPTDNLAGAEIGRLPEAVRLADRLLEHRSPSDILLRFWVTGFADPADGQPHGTLIGTDTDYGAISFAPNPYDETGEFVSIICAGVHGPGTAHAIKALATAPEKFERHPFGGVIKVRLPGRRDWPARIDEADWQWETQDYTPEKILTNLAEARTADKKLMPAMRHWTDDGRKDTARFIRRLLDAGDEVPRPASWPDAVAVSG